MNQDFPITMNYGRAIRICRSAFGLTQAELADRLDVGASQISLIEAGKRQPSERTIADICENLAIPRSLLTLLASDTKELAQEDDEVLGTLARRLLYLLAEADDDRQSRIDFRAN